MVLHLKDLFEACREENRIPASWVEAQISILLKQGKDINLPQSYRTIAILNVDYKNFTTLLATRLNKILAYYIHEDRTRFMHKRDNTRRLCNIIDFMNERKIPALI